MDDDHDSAESFLTAIAAVGAGVLGSVFFLIAAFLFLLAGILH